MIFLLMLFVFVLAIFAGNELISKVPPTLHTPLMSGANAISGITIVGALMCAQFGNGGGVSESAATILGVCAITFAMINVVGGFMVTDRMLSMFGSKKKKK
ncbi:MAG TPA: NAD(P) transhydrogenase subunit alpha [Planctomycetota bacterium]|jgi:NAD(P) transhydrogenase subunit alpha|nr:NAD(P) transhydrogenase subunit alpha [Planctomycetota bacterium]MDP6129324.1 NAD(P) transhydrogenase subunit alpha [Planctomycetota bacterium]MDP7245262.1 NAD(P) transhydrogenase subunit alpha [Planctomycetota bacterium]MDP7559838.1 NAD(P) transhydrogenase subunit alpha [Planctomycetota bacterium]HJM39022.1 NAD(P) transhydrogenase subunit alpha [Planctomycetota bacterium]|tara:strand:- start:6985 stop:7287 length:303 start_codon:yes stop_codon:yes gene_type:complete